MAGQPNPYRCWPTGSSLLLAGVTPGGDQRSTRLRIPDRQDPSHRCRTS